MEEAIAWPELAVMSARAHGNRPDGIAVNIAAITACHVLAAGGDERGTLYNDAVMSRLSRQARALLEAEMQARDYEYQSEFARRYVQQGRVAGVRQACRTALEAKLVTVSPEVEALLETLVDLDSLDALLHEVVSAPDAAAARAALERRAPGSSDGV